MWQHGSTIPVDLLCPYVGPATTCAAHRLQTQAGKAGARPARRFVAEKIIEYAQRGVVDPAMLEAMALKEYGVDKKI
jgi:hypothetical protein